MQQTKYFCDKCGEEIKVKEDNYPPRVEAEFLSIPGINWDKRKKQLQLCLTHIKELRDYFKI